MDIGSIATTGASGVIVGLVGKIIWDWLKSKPTTPTNHTIDPTKNGFYRLQEDIALLTQTANNIEAMQQSPEMRRLIEESHMLYQDRVDLKVVLEKQNIISIETNILLKELRDELAKTSAQFAAVATGLSAALHKIKGD
jgi:hypothetical protein